MRSAPECEGTGQPPGFLEMQNLERGAVALGFLKQGCSSAYSKKSDQRD